MAEKEKKVVLVKIILDRPGARKCGEYVAGVVYEVDKDVSVRLLEAKGFRLATKTDEAPVEVEADNAKSTEGVK